MKKLLCLCAAFALFAAVGCEEKKSSAPASTGGVSGGRVMRQLVAALVCGAALVAVGCGNSGEKGKHKDKDVPKAGTADK